MALDIVKVHFEVIPNLKYIIYLCALVRSFLRMAVFLMEMSEAYLFNVDMPYIMVLQYVYIYLSLYIYIYMCVNIIHTASQLFVDNF